MIEKYVYLLAHVGNRVHIMIKDGQFVFPGGAVSADEAGEEPLRVLVRRLEQEYIALPSQGSIRFLVERTVRDTSQQAIASVRVYEATLAATRAWQMEGIPMVGYATVALEPLLRQPALAAPVTRAVWWVAREYNFVV